MPDPLPPPPDPIPPLRWALALGVAAASDALSFPLELMPPAQWAVDGATALILFFVLKRPMWLLVPLVCEAIPGVMLAPSWVLSVAALWAGKHMLKK